MLLPAALNAQIAGAPFTCDVVFYQMRNVGNTSLPVKFAAVNATVTPTAVYTTIQGTALNSIGYNPVDNYMYGIRINPVAGQGPLLYRVGQTGYELVGIIQPSPLMSATILNNFTPTAGVFDAGGRYYFAGQGGGNISPSGIFRVDFIPVTGNPTVAHQYTITAAITNFGDFDFNGAGSPNGLLLGSTGTNHYRINLATGATSINGTATVSTVALATANVGGVGSAFYDAFTGRFYVFDNGTSKFWQITNPQAGTPDGVATTAVAYVGPPTFGGPFTPTDGTSCPISGTRVADLAITKSDGVASVPNGAVVSYTITVTNAGPYPANYAVVRDPANTPALTKTSVTCSAPVGPPTAVCPPTLSIASLEAGVPVLTFPPGTTLVFTVNAKVSATVSVSNTATVAPALDTTDPNPSNNTATDTDVITATNTVVVTAASICKAGTIESYTNLVVNGDFALASPLSTAATVGLPNTYNAANSVSLQTGSRSYVVGAMNLQQNPFPGDGARSIPGSNSWLLSNGKTPAANYSVWNQIVSGLTPGKVYEFMTYISNASNPGSGSTPLPSLQLQANGANLAGATFAPVAIEAALDTWTLVQGTFTAVVSTATVSIIDALAGAAADPSTGDVVGIAQATVRQCSDSADVAVTKTNGTNTVVSTGTTAYTVTLVNLSGTVNATNTQVIDQAAAGIIKTGVTCTASGASTCPGGGSTSTPTVAAFEAGVTVPLIVANGTVTFKVFASITAAPGATVSNVVTVAGIGYTDSNPANNQATDTDNVIGQANLTVTKTNSPTGTVTAGGTTSYIVTVGNTGPATAQNISLTDPPVAGLRCTAVTCTGVVGATTCPAPAGVTIAILQGAGIQLPLMTPPSSISFHIDCGVTATGQ
ncbi:hypothetical protein BH11PSE7_BH11PSE7_36420 [soil metagenome]